MDQVTIGKHNVGRIAERIVANELEYRGFRISDLNKEGLSANADLLAAKDGKTWQIQVKGASVVETDNGSWVGYGFCNDEIIAGKRPMFNNKPSDFYKAQIVILVAVKSPDDYTCVVMPERIAEKAAQINLDYAFRTPKKDGSPKKPGKVWVSLVHLPKVRDASKVEPMKAEQKLITPYINNWNIESPAISSDSAN
jgi:hypothetical protein